MKRGRENAAAYKPERDAPVYHCRGYTKSLSEETYEVSIPRLSSGFEIKRRERERENKR